MYRSLRFRRRRAGLLAEMSNRWRDQLKLAPISEWCKPARQCRSVGTTCFCRSVSEQPISPDRSTSRILGGILPINGETWVLKMIGPDQLVESQRDAFKQFLEACALRERSGVSTPAPISANTGGNDTNTPTPPPIEAAQGAVAMHSQRTGRRSRSHRCVWSVSGWRA